MLFDLKGKRRRVVQATYVGLAVLIGVGLVGAGVGSSVSGGLFDIFGGGDNSGGGGDSVLQKRVDAAQRRAATHPRDPAALADLTRARFQLAGQESDQRTGAYGPKAKADLQKAGDAWQRYLAAANGKPDPALARIMLQAYGDGGLNHPPQAAQAAEIVAAAQPSANTYLLLDRYARLAGQTRKADLAGQRAIDLAPKDQRKLVKDEVKQLKQAPGAGGASAGQGR